jgi:protein YibB
MGQPTVVTAFYDLGRGTWPAVVRGRTLPAYQHRTVDEYFACFARLAALRNDMVIFTPPAFADRVRALRRTQAPDSRTDVIAIAPIEDEYPALVDRLSDRMEAMYAYAPGYLQAPYLPEYWHPRYVLVNVAKAAFVCRAYEEAVVDRCALAAWIDFGYCRDDRAVPQSRRWSYDFGPDKMHLFALREPDVKRPIFDVVRSGDVYIMGCHMVGDRRAWQRLCARNFTNVEILMKCGLVDDDQTVLLMSYLDAPDDVELHRMRLDAGWFVILTAFNTLA